MSIRVDNLSAAWILGSVGRKTDGVVRGVVQGEVSGGRIAAARLGEVHERRKDQRLRWLGRRVGRSTACTQQHIEQ